MTVKKFTIGDVIDSIEKNGLKQIERYFYEFQRRGATSQEPFSIDHKTDTIEAVCALGQASINLQVTNPNTWYIEYKTDVLDPQYGRNIGILDRFRHLVFSLNDSAGKSFKEIAEILREDFVEYLDVEIKAQSFDWTPYLPEGYTTNESE